MAVAPARATRNPMTHTGFVVRIRLMFANLALRGALLVVAAQQDSDAVPPLPAGIESVSPDPDSLVDPQTQLTADLNDTYTGVLQFDGVEIPEDQLARIVELGQVTFTPGDGLEFSEFTAGQHVVTVIYWHQTESRETDARSFSWRIRIAA